MGKVSIQYPHQRTQNEAREAANHFAEKLHAKLAVNYSWQGDAMQLERQGVKGELILAAGEVKVELKLNMMLTPMQGQIEAEIRRQLEKYLG
jgi:putative polyhydroxyalkanoate system protein